MSLLPKTSILSQNLSPRTLVYLGSQQYCGSRHGYFIVNTFSCTEQSTNEDQPFKEGMSFWPLCAS